MVARGKKPTARGWSHAIAAVIALVFSIAMAMKTSANVEHMLSVVVFGASMVLLFSMSAVYHLGRYSDGVRLTLRAIYPLKHLSSHRGDVHANHRDRS